MTQPFVASCAMFAALAMVAAPIAPLAAQDAEVFSGSTDWALDYGEDYCRLMRDFSNGSDRVGLVIERTQPGPMMRVLLVGDSLKPFRGAEQIGYNLLPSGGERQAQKVQLQTGDGQNLLNLGSTTLADFIPPAPGTAPQTPPPYRRDSEQQVASGITGIALSSGLSKPVRIETGELGGPIEALQACADDLMASWGLDAEAHKTLTRPAFPAAPTAGWVASDTVGFADFARLSGGNNEIRVLIDAAGKPTACHIQWPSLSAAVNEKICSAVMSKGTFTPALDAAGQPIASFWTTSVFFLMPPFGR